MADDAKTYIGIKPCGCVTYASVAGYEPARSEKAELKRVIKSGRRIEIVTAAEARERLTFDCPHSGPPIADVAAEADRLFEAANGA